MSRANDVPFLKAIQPRKSSNIEYFPVCVASRFPALSKSRMTQPGKESMYVRWSLDIALIVLFIIESSNPGHLQGVGAGLIALAAAASVAQLHLQLPVQNLLRAALITALIGGIAFGLSGLPAIAMPFGPIVFQPAAGGKILDILPWTIPLLCIMVIFSARGVGRLIMRPWRKTKKYGWWLIGLTAALVAAFDFALEPFAVHTAKLWLWQPTKIPLTWQGASPFCPIAWFFMTVLILALITPSFIRKQPGGHSPPDYHPLVVWLGALVLFGVSSAKIGDWLPVEIDATVAAVTLIFAVRGGKW
jgi:hypothetical protein